MLKYYKKALLVHGTENTDIRSIVATLEREIFLDGYFKAFAMAAGPCLLCNECAKVCRHAEKAWSSLEACGIDVYTTVRANGFPIKVLRTKSCASNYYGIVLIE
jgi:predicted metal-binding protein